MTTLFVSDLHLCQSRPVITGLFFDFLKEIAPQAEALYILGDLFEYWVGDDDMPDPFNKSVCTALANCPTPLYFVVGNRDFLLGEQFCAATGGTLLSDEVIVEIEGEPTLLLHGDTLCTDDTAYQHFRKEVRSSTWQNQFLSRSLSERKAQVETLRRASEEQKQHKSMAIMDANSIAIEQAFRQHTTRTMVHGHTHRLATHQHMIATEIATRHVLGDWHNNAHGGNYLARNAEGWHRHLWRA